MRVCSVKWIVVLLLVVCVGSSLPAWAQMSDTGTVVGRVTDPSGAVVTGAKVTLTDTSTSSSSSAQTNDAGRYIFVNVKPGIYNISLSKTGFSTTKSEHQEVKVGTTLTVDLGLQVGAANVVVEVNAAGSELQTMDATVGQTITGNALDSLPGLGRDVSTFVTLQPGVAPDGSVSGANQDQNSFALDGGQNSSDMDGTQNTYTPSFASDPTGGLINYQVTGTAPAGASGGGGPTGVMPTPADSIEEFRVGTNNQTADFNSSSGAQVRLVTKRGTNQWHGTAYEYYLDNNWAANTFDNNANGVKRPSFHYSRFGGSIGGPLPLKDLLGGKWFFFGNYEGFRWPNSASVVRTTPSADMRLGLLTFNGVTYNLNPTAVVSPDLGTVPGNANCDAAHGFPGGVCDPQGLGISPTIQALWQFMPPSNAPVVGGVPSCDGNSRCDHYNVQAWSSNYPTTWNDNFAVARLDHDFSSKWHFYSTYRYYHQMRTTGDQLDIGNWPTGGAGVGVARSVHNRPQVPWFFTASMTTNITNNVINDFHYSYLRNNWARNGLGEPPQVPGLDGALEPEGEQHYSVLAPYNVNTQNVRTRYWDGKDHLFRDDVSWIKGKHFFQFGGSYQHNWDAHQRTDNGLGTNYAPTYILGDNGGGDTNGMIMTGYIPSGLTNSQTTLWKRAYGITLGAPSITQIAYIRAGNDLTLQTPLGTVPATDRSTIPFYNLYASDSWHLKPTVTVSYGLGWALEMPPTETNGKQVVVIDPDGKLLDSQKYLNTRASEALNGQVYNPALGYALIGNVAGHPKYVYNPFYKGFSPRVAVAWNPQFDSDSMGGKIFGHNNTVIRGGYSILYSRQNGVNLVLGPMLGYGIIQGVNCASPDKSGGCNPLGTTPATSWRIGPTSGGFDGLTAPLGCLTATLPAQVYPGFTDCAGISPEGIDPNIRPSRNQEFDLTVQRQLSSKMSIEVGYIGRKIAHEFQPVSLNPVPYMMTLGGQRFDNAYGQMVSQYCDLAHGGMAGGNCAGNLSAVTMQPFFEAAMAGTGYCTGYANCAQAVADRQADNIANANVWNIWSALDGGGATCNANGKFPYTNGTFGPCGFNFARSMANSPINCVTGTDIGCSGQYTAGIGESTSYGWGS